MATDLGAEFHARCQQLVEDIECVLRFRPKTFDDGDPVETAKGLVLGRTSSIFLRLKEKGRPDLTIEHIIAEERKWDVFFSNTHRNAARARLRGDPSSGSKSSAGNVSGDVRAVRWATRFRIQRRGRRGLHADGGP